MENKCAFPPESEAPVTVEVKRSEMQIPDHAIRRFAKFLLPKIQADLSKDQEQNHTTEG